MRSFDKFYNKDRKLLFVEEYSKQGKTEQAIKTRANNCYSVFGNVCSIENKYNKDLCEFLYGGPETDDLYLTWFNNISCGRATIYTTMIRAYVKWCYENNYINAKTYSEHGLIFECRKRPNNEKNVTNAIKIKQMKLAENNEVSTEFIFENEEAFLKYIQELFRDEKYVMTAAVAVLLYYQFDFNTIRDILKTDVDEERHTVLNTPIENEDAFKIIYKAKVATEYTTFVDYVTRSASGFTRVETYMDCPYLLRTTSRGIKNPTGKISASYACRFVSFEKEAMKTLPADSLYKGILIRSNTISKLKTFHRIREDEMKFGLKYVEEAIKDNRYNSTMTYYNYCLMASKMKSIK